MRLVTYKMFFISCNVCVNENLYSGLINLPSLQLFVLPYDIAPLSQKQAHKRDSFEFTVRIFQVSKKADLPRVIDCETQIDYFVLFIPIYKIF